MAEINHGHLQPEKFEMMWLNPAFWAIAPYQSSKPSRRGNGFPKPMSHVSSSVIMLYQ